MAYGKNAPFGLRPHSSIGGGAWTEKTNHYPISATADGLTTQARSIFTGDPVYWGAAAANNGGGTITTVEASAANTQPLGVFWGCIYYDVNNVLQKRSCWIGGTPVYKNTKITAMIIDDPNVVWEIQYSTSTNTLADAEFLPTYLGQNSRVNLANGGGNLVPNNPATGDVSTGLSARYLDGASDGSAATSELKIINYSLNPQNYIYDSAGNVRPFLNALVIFNNHIFKSAGTIGTVAA